MDNKNKSMGLFLHPQNTYYLKSILPKCVTMDHLTQSMRSFTDNHIMEINNLTDPWANVRYLNKMFMSKFDPFPSISNSYSSFGEEDFMNNQVRFGDMYKLQRNCKTGKTCQTLYMPNDMTTRDPIYNYTPDPKRISWLNSVNKWSYPSCSVLKYR